MKITPHQATIAKIQADAHTASEKKPVKGSDVAHGDRVSLSPQARELVEARRALDAISDVREDIVAEIRERIATGTYRIDAEAIADKMVRDAFPDKT